MHLCQAWLDLRGAPLHCVVVSEERAGTIPKWPPSSRAARSLHAHVTALPDALYSALSQVEHGVGLMFLVETPAPRAARQPDRVNAVLLDGVQDPGNVGSVLRSACGRRHRTGVLHRRQRILLVAQGAARGEGRALRARDAENVDLAPLIAASNIAVLATSGYATRRV